MMYGGILFWILIGVVIYLMMKGGGGCCGGHDHHGGNQGHEDHLKSEDKTAHGN